MVQNHLLVDADPSDNSGKTHKIIQTLNEATNKISHTGTAFSSGNWETDTMAYMESIKDLPHERIQEILTRAEGYMKHARPQRRTSDTGDEPSGSNGSIAPVNKRSRLRICNVHFSSFFSTANNIYSTGVSMHDFSSTYFSDLVLTRVTSQIPSFPIIFQVVHCQLQSLATCILYHVPKLTPFTVRFGRYAPACLNS